MTTYTLAADIGGTNSTFALTAASDEVFTTRLDSQAFADFDAVLSEFLNQADVASENIISACFAIAGPVSGETATVTNLPWIVNTQAVADKFDIAHVRLCNDFEAVGQGIAGLADDDLLSLQAGEPDLNAPRAVIGAGTGLGQAFLIPRTHNGVQQWQVFPTEGGHTDFAPMEVAQIPLWEKLTQRLGHVSYERVVSGRGLVEIYRFLQETGQAAESSACREAMLAGDAAAEISRFALVEQDELALMAIDWFIRLYGAQAGNFALSILPRGGFYLAGGIAAKNRAAFEDGRFIEAFLNKGRMRPILERVPVRLILRSDVGLLGAQLLSKQVQ